MVHMASAIRRAAGPRAELADPSRPLAVVAVGGNALTGTDESGTSSEIAANARQMARSLAHLVAAGWGVAVVHGNGPQVGNLAIQQEEGGALVPAQPLHQLVAMTQGQLGGVLARAIDRQCGAGVAVAVVTHVRVDPGDRAFRRPTKPIGPFFSAERADDLARDRGWRVAQDAGRGYRRVVASPIPLDIVEIDAIRTLLDAGHVVLAAGGGGVPVRATAGGGEVVPVDAVVDKDRSAAVLAAAVGASVLFLLTGVDAVLLDYATPDQRPVHVLTSAEAEHHAARGQFPAGSMGPKVAAALQFLREGGERAVITSARRLAEVVAGEPGVGTRIERAAQPVGSAP